MKLPGQSRRGGGKTHLTNHRAAVVLHALGCGCYRETAAPLADVTPETLAHWMKWEGEPYATFQRLVREAEADLEARMVKALTSQAHVRPELPLAILERKFPQRWAKVTVVAMPPPSRKGKAFPLPDRELYGGSWAQILALWLDIVRKLLSILSLSKEEHRIDDP